MSSTRFILSMAAFSANHAFNPSWQQAIDDCLLELPICEFGKDVVHYALNEKTPKLLSSTSAASAFLYGRESSFCLPL